MPSTRMHFLFALHVDRQLLRAAVLFRSLAPFGPALAPLARIGLFQVGLLFVPRPCLRLIFVRLVDSGIRCHVAGHIVVRGVVLRGLVAFLPRDSGTRRTGAVRRIPVQAVMCFLQIR